MPLYRLSADMASTQVWPILWENWNLEIICNLCITRLRYQVSDHNTFYIICSAISHRSSKCFSIHNKGQSWHFMNNSSCMIDKHSHSMNQYLAINWMFCDKMQFQTCTYLTINEFIFPWAQCWSVSHDVQIWITLGCEALLNAGFCHLVVCHTL